jgi:hypothetical protein
LVKGSGDRPIDQIKASAYSYLGNAERRVDPPRAINSQDAADKADGGGDGIKIGNLWLVHGL